MSKTRRLLEVKRWYLFGKLDYFKTQLGMKKAFRDSFHGQTICDHHMTTAYIKCEIKQLRSEIAGVDKKLKKVRGF